MPRVIKRYDNRKLYDMEEKRYIRLQDVAALVRSGQEVLVQDNATGADLTAQTLAKVIVEGGPDNTPALSTRFLHDLVRWGGDVLSAGKDQLDNGMERLVQASLAKLAPLPEMRAGMEQLKKRVDQLEALINEIEREEKNGRHNNERDAQRGAD